MTHMSSELSLLGAMPAEFRFSDSTVETDARTQRIQRLSAGFYEVLRKLYEADKIHLIVTDPAHEEQLANVALNAAIEAEKEVNHWEQMKPVRNMGWD